MPNSRSKTDALYRQLREDICALRLHPGDPLRLPTLSERYDTGLTPLRECLNRLSTEKLVVPVYNKGFQVAPLSLRDLLDLERSRSVIEGHLFSEAMARGDDAWETQVVGTFHHLSKMPPPSVLRAPNDLARWSRYHGAFHTALTSAAHSVWLHHFNSQLGLLLGRYHLFIQNGLRDLARTHPEVAGAAAEAFTRAMALQPHEVLYKIAMARDVTAGRDAFTSHSNLSIDAFENLLGLLPRHTTVAATLRPTAGDAHP